ncbi:MAG: RCC1 domain-containing protein [Caulobacteraceae bacterium]
MRKRSLVCFIVLLIVIQIVNINVYGETEKDSLKVSAISSFMNNTAVLMEDGTVWAWGDDSSKQLGTGIESKYSFSPVKIDGMSQMVSVSAGNGYILAVKNDGTVWGIGSNSNGVLSTSKTADMYEKPIKISELSNIKEVSSGISYALAVNAQGNVYIWGNYPLKTTGNRVFAPQKAVYLEEIDKVISSRYNAFAIDKNGRTWAFRGITNRPYEITFIDHINSITETMKYTYASDEEGNVWYWDINGNNPKMLDGISGIVGIRDISGNGIVALDSKGFIWVCYDMNMKPQKLSFIDNAKVAVSGSSHFSALKSDGTVWSWGDNTYGQLGNGGGFFFTSPQIVNGLEDVKTVATAKTYAAALKDDGTVWMWGDNTYGQLGDGTKQAKYHPVKVEGISDIVQISLGYSHVVALKKDGTLWTWGSNSNGELGDGTYEERLKPVQVTGIDNVKSVSAGKEFTIALQKNSTLWVWGSSGYEPKISSRKIERSIPVRIDETNNVRTIEARGEYALFLRNDAAVWGIGNNINGRLGYKESEDESLVKLPKMIQGTLNTKYISLGVDHVLSIKNDSTLRVWGSNSYGQLGTGRKGGSNTPFPVKDMDNIRLVSAGSNHSFAIKNDGSIWGWGDNSFGQLGTANVKEIDTPQKIDSLYNLKYISAGYDYTLAVALDGKVWVWGDNTYGQLGLGDIQSKFYKDPVKCIFGN